MSTVTAYAHSAHGPVAPSPQGTCLEPLPIVSVKLHDPAMWAQWRARNRDVTIPFGIVQLERAGNLDNFRRLVGRSDSAYRGYPFNDTDVYKTLEAIAWSGRSDADDALGRFFRDVVDLLATAQSAEGMLNSYIQGDSRRTPYADLAVSHELYNAGHLIQAAIADRRITGQHGLFTVACRVADHLVATFGAGRRDDYDGHPEVETALVELFRETGNRDYLDLASQLVESRGSRIFARDRRGLNYFQDRDPIRSQRQIVGHAVRAVYLEAGVVDLAVETGDTQLLESSRQRWHDMVARKLYLTGGVGSRHKSESFGDPYELPPDRAYCETCAAIGVVQWSWRLLLATGESRYADLIERTVYNGLAAAIGADGTSFFYSNPLQVRDEHEALDEEESGLRLPWYECACCPPNLMRLFASLPHYVATKTPRGLQIHQYTAASVSGELLAGSVEIEVATDYPTSGVVAIEVTRSIEQPWEVSLRVPTWASSEARLTVNQTTVAVTPDENGYARLDRKWSVGDRIVFSMPVAPRVTVANNRVDAVRDCVAVERGPIVYCVESADNPGVDLFDVAVDPNQPIGERDIGHLLLPTLVLAGGVSADNADSSLYGPDSAIDGVLTPRDLIAIPYMSWGNRAAGGMRVWVRRWRDAP